MVLPDGATATTQPPPVSSSENTTTPPPPPPPPSQPAAKSNPKPPAPKASGGYAHLFKFLLLGDWATGKTALMQRYCSDTFNEEHVSTIGIDFSIKTVDLPNGDRVKLQIWDTAGQERFRTITTSYYRGASAIFVVYQTDDKLSLDSVPRWLEEAERFSDENSIRVVVCNKTDLPDSGKDVWGKDRLLDRLSDEGISVSTAPGASNSVFGVYEASAKTGEGVGEVFGAVTEELVNRRLNERNPLRAGGRGRGRGEETGRVRLGVKDKPKSRFC